MKKLLLITLILAIALGVWSSAGLGQQDKPVRTVMKAKLKHAQAILKGLAVEDFVEIRTNAERLSALSRAAEWNIHKGPEYARHSKDFRATVDEMAQHAKDQKLDACTLDYVQMTMICVRCHKHVRHLGIGLGFDDQQTESFALQILDNANSH